VRHVSKYIDIPVVDAKAFIFWNDRFPTGRRARTLREFADVLEHSRGADVAGHLRRSDLSRWIGQVFGDYTLATTIRQVEDLYRADPGTNAPAIIATAIRNRYEFVESDWMARKTDER
jgi:hypothetical protein